MKMENQQRESFHNRLIKLRKEKKVTQKQLADALFISRSVVAKWENGLIVPNEENLKQLNDYFELNSSPLILDKDNEKLSTYSQKIKYSFKEFIRLFGRHILISFCIIVGSITIMLICMNLYDEKVNKYQETYFTTGDCSGHFLDYDNHSIVISEMKNDKTVNIPSHIMAKTPNMILYHNAVVKEVNLSCFSYANVYLPNTIEKIYFRSDTFKGLSSISIASDNPTYYSVDNCIIEKETNELVYVSNSGIIPRNIHKIGWDTLSYYSANSIIIPKEITNMIGIFYINPNTAIYLERSYYDFSTERSAFLEYSLYDMENEWKEALENIKKQIWFYSSTMPKTKGQYWHYNEENMPVRWEV